MARIKISYCLLAIILTTFSLSAPANWLEGLTETQCQQLPVLRQSLEQIMVLFKKRKNEDEDLTPQIKAFYQTLKKEAYLKEWFAFTDPIDGMAHAYLSKKAVLFLLSTRHPDRFENGTLKYIRTQSTKENRTEALRLVLKRFFDQLPESGKTQKEYLDLLKKESPSAGEAVHQALLSSCTFSCAQWFYDELQGFSPSEERLYLVQHQNGQHSMTVYIRHNADGHWRILLADSLRVFYDYSQEALKERADAATVAQAVNKGDLSMEKLSQLTRITKDAIIRRRSGTSLDSQLVTFSLMAAIECLKGRNVKFYYLPGVRQASPVHCMIYALEDIRTLCESPMKPGYGWQVSQQKGRSSLNFRLWSPMFFDICRLGGEISVNAEPFLSPLISEKIRDSSINILENHTQALDAVSLDLTQLRESLSPAEASTLMCQNEYATKPILISATRLIPETATAFSFVPLTRFPARLTALTQGTKDFDSLTAALPKDDKVTTKNNIQTAKAMWQANQGLLSIGGVIKKVNLGAQEKLMEAIVEIVSSLESLYAR